MTSRAIVDRDARAACLAFLRSVGCPETIRLKWAPANELLLQVVGKKASLERNRLAAWKRRGWLTMLEEHKDGQTLEFEEEILEEARAEA